MICFERDYERAKDVMHDYKTNNKSFLEMASKLRMQGIRNHQFFLTLYQKDLAGLNPHDVDNLTADQKRKIALECRFNPWYFFREVLRVKPQAGSDSVPLRLNRGNLALFFCFLNWLICALIQPRQTGKSVSTDAMMVWVLCYGAENSRVCMITKDDTLRRANVERIKDMIDLLPDYLNPVDKRSDANNQQLITVNAKKNVYESGVSQASEAGAYKLGRGLTAPIFHIDELAFINLIGITLPAALAAGGAARDEARAHQRPNGTIFTTTAGKKDNRDGKYAYDTIHGGMVWDELLFDSFNRASLHERVKKGSKNIMYLINATFSHTQLGYTDKWLYNKLSESGATGEDADRDYFNVWTSGQLGSPFTISVLKRIAESRSKPLFTEFTGDNYQVRWHITKEERDEDVRRDVKYVMGLDMSDGLGRDEIAGTLLRVTDLKPVGAFTFNETLIGRVSDFIFDLMVAMPNVVLMPERKSSAVAVIDHLIIKFSAIDIDPFKRIYCRAIDENAVYKEDYKRIITTDMRSRNYQFYETLKKYFGYNTAATGTHSRSNLFGNNLINSATRTADYLCDEKICEQLLSLVIKDNRIDHQASGHDDAVVSWLLCHWLLNSSRNLRYYGIEPGMIGIVNHAEESLSDEERYQLHIQKTISEEIKKTYKQLQDESNDLVASRLEHKLRALSGRLSASSTASLGIDALLSEMEERSDLRVIQNRRQADRIDIGQIKQSIHSRASSQRYARAA